MVPELKGTGMAATPALPMRERLPSRCRRSRCEWPMRLSRSPSTQPASAKGSSPAHTCSSSSERSSASSCHVAADSAASAASDGAKTVSRTAVGSAWLESAGSSSSIRACRIIAPKRLQPADAATVPKLASAIPQPLAEQPHTSRRVSSTPRPPKLTSLAIPLPPCAQLRLTSPHPCLPETSSSASSWARGPSGGPCAFQGAS
eukprot:scaffold133232_cov28-Tisochrysis_lutea.AAC.2